MRPLLGVGHVLGLLAMLLSLTYLLPIAASLIYGDGMIHVFALAIAFNFSVGYIMWLVTRRYAPELQARDGFLLVSCTWAGGAAFSAVPLLLAIPGLSLTDAYFEAMSGLTTSGGTILSNLDRLPPSINLWRHEIEWLGGMGIIVIAVAVLPLLRVGGMQLYRAETPGPMKDAKLTPRITETARNLWLVYAALTAACIACLKVAGMSWLDAVCHAFSVMSLGGFSTHDQSIGYFHSTTIELVLMVFMLIAAMNFATHFLAWRKRTLRVYLQDPEAKAIIAVIALSCFGVAFYVWHAGTYASYWTALRKVSFNVVSVATDCGLVSTNYNHWPIFAPMWMLFLSCLVASSGSTGGGIKMIRTLILVRQAGREMLQLLHPQVVNPLKIGGTAVPNKVIFSVLGFIFVYFMSVATLTFAMMASGLDFTSSFSAIIASINNAGPGLAAVGPGTNYASLTAVQTWLCTAAMLLGRIEVFTLLILFSPAFWRN